MREDKQNLPNLDLTAFRTDLESCMELRGNSMHFNSSKLQDTANLGPYYKLLNSQLKEQVIEAGDRYSGYLNTLINEKGLVDEAKTTGKDLKSLALQEASRSDHKYQDNDLGRAFKEIVKSILEALGLYERHFDTMDRVKQTTEKEGIHASKLMEERQEKSGQRER